MGKGRKTKEVEHEEQCSECNGKGCGACHGGMVTVVETEVYYEDE